MRTPVIAVVALGLFTVRAESGVVAHNHPAVGGLSLAVQQHAGPSATPFTATAHSFHTALAPQGASVVHAQQETPFERELQDLEHRWFLNSARFEHFHPVAGPLVGEIIHFQQGLCPPLNPIATQWIDRRDLNPTRFDHFHPLLGSLLALDEILRKQCQQPPHGGQVVLPPGGGTTNNGGSPPPNSPPIPPSPPPSPPPLGESLTPEPSSLVLSGLGVVLVSLGGLRRRRSRG